MPLEQLPEQIEELEAQLDRMRDVAGRLEKIRDEAEWLEGDIRKTAGRAEALLSDLREIEAMRRDGNPWEAQEEYQDGTLTEHQRVVERTKHVVGTRIEEFAEKLGNILDVEGDRP